MSLVVVVYMKNIYKLKTNNIMVVLSNDNEDAFDTSDSGTNNGAGVGEFDPSNKSIISNKKSLVGKMDGR